MIEVKVKTLTWEAQDIVSCALHPLPGQQLPSFTAGAHIDVHLPGGLIRSYSLVNDPDEINRYVIAVSLDPKSRGGSSYIHRQLRVGSRLAISPPKNNFPLFEAASHSVFIAGGIGVTPLLSMVRRLKKAGRTWDLHFCARTREHAAYLDELQALADSSLFRLHTHFDQEPGGKPLDIAALVRSTPPGVHLYCCGPLPMLDAFETATNSRPSDQVHLEYFSAKSPPDNSGGFAVELAKSGKTIVVPKGKTILDAILEQRIDIPFACTEGVCGECETRVIAGEPIHRDVFLTKDEQASNKVMMICCSGCKGDKLVLDI
jgi:ferredoxin-NADP reductase